MALNNDMRLQFRMGSKSGLDAITTRTPGTVYVTTDEQAMYVDINAEKRIRISDIIQLNSPKDLGEPPYSTEGFYYFAQDNALMKCTGQNAEGGWDWKQLNSVSDVTANLNAVEGRVTTVEGIVAKLNGADTVSGSVAEAKKAADAAKAVADQAVLDAKAADNKAVAAGTAAQNAQAKADANEGKINTLTGRVDTAEGAIATLTSTDVTKDGSVAKAQKTAENAAAAASAADTKAGNAAAAASAAQGTADEALSKAGTNATNIATIDGRLGAAEGKVTQLTSDLSGLTTRVSQAETDIDALEAYRAVLEGDGDGSVKDAKAAGTAAAAVASQNAKDIAGLDGRLTEAEGTLKTAVESTIPGINNKLGESNAAASADTAFGRIKGLEDNLGKSDAQASTDTAFGRIKALETAIGGDVEGGSISEKLQDVIDLAGTTEGKVNELISTTTEQDTAIKNIQATLGKTDGSEEGTVFGAISKNETDIAENAKDIAALEKTVGDANSGLVQLVNTNASNIEAVTGRVDDLEVVLPRDYVSKADYAEDKEDLAEQMEEQHNLIIESINAANGMVYSGSVTAYSELPTSDVKVGATYIVANEEGFVNGSENYFAGDLLIARGTEENGVITSGLAWDHVKTGYIRKHEATLDTAQQTEKVNGETVNKNATDVKLVSHLGEALSKFTIQGAQNVTVSVDANDVITVGMAWDTF